MLYDFHKYQNDLRANSVHATYLVYGAKMVSDSQSDQDVEMDSSMPDQDVTTEEAPISTLTLAREEELQGNKGLF